MKSELLKFGTVAIFGHMKSGTNMESGQWTIYSFFYNETGWEKLKDI